MKNPYLPFAKYLVKNNKSKKPASYVLQTLGDGETLDPNFKLTHRAFIMDELIKFKNEINKKCKRKVICTVRGDNGN